MVTKMYQLLPNKLSIRAKILIDSNSGSLIQKWLQRMFSYFILYFLFHLAIRGQNTFIPNIISEIPVRVSSIRQNATSPVLYTGVNPNFGSNIIIKINTNIEDKKIPCVTLTISFSHRIFSFRFRDSELFILNKPQI